MRIAALVLAGLLATAAPAAAQHHGDHGALHAGNAEPYPDVREHALGHRRKARALRLATLRAATRFDTVEEAAARGYVANPEVSPLYRPGLQHFRANGLRGERRLLRRGRPQALVFWCPSVGACRLAAFMYRAPAGMAPPTYGGLLGWHRHGLRGTWMTHVWLADSVRSALAQCAPFNALQIRDPGLVWEPYTPDVPGVDEPCPDTAGLTPPP